MVCNEVFKMPIYDYEEIAVGAVGGAFFPAMFQQYSAGTSGVTGLKDLPGPLKEKPVQAGVFAGLGGLALSAMGARDAGPLAGNESAINMLSAFGAASLGTSLTFAMYPIEERAAAAKAAGVTAGPRVTAKPGAVEALEVEVGSSPQSSSGSSVSVESTESESGLSLENKSESTISL